jgi:hypothetical protein
MLPSRRSKNIKRPFKTPEAEYTFRLHRKMHRRFG